MHSRVLGDVPPKRWACPTVNDSSRLAVSRAIRLLANQLEATAKPHVLRLAESKLQAFIATGNATPEPCQQLGAEPELLGRPNEALDAYSRGQAVEPPHLSLGQLRGGTSGTPCAPLIIGP